MMRALLAIVAAAVVAAGLVTLAPPVIRVTAVMPPLEAYTDLAHQCRYMIGGLTDDGFHVFISGDGDPVKCRNRIIIYGVPLVPVRKASR